VKHDDAGARRHYETALARLVALAGERQTSVARIHTALCGLDVKTQPALARPHCDAARAYFSAAGDGQRANLARVLWQSADLEPTRGEQLAALEAARATLRETSGPDSLDVGTLSGRIATIEFNQRRYAKAAAALQTQIDTIERAFGTSNRKLPERYRALARSLQLAGALDKARDAFDHALALVEASNPPDPNELLQSLLESGNLRAAIGDSSGRPLLERALTLAAGGQLPDPTGERRGSALLMIASSLSAQGSDDEALEYLGRATAVKDRNIRIYALLQRASVYAHDKRATHRADADIARARALARDPRDRVAVDSGACSVYVAQERWQLAQRMCATAAKATPAGTALRAMLDATLAEAELGLGHVKKARATVEDLATKDPVALGAPAGFRGELMFIVARARRADGDEAGAAAAADEAERELAAQGLDGRRTLDRVVAWRAESAR